jgi:type I restriction enzyme, S subunit
MRKISLSEVLSKSEERANLSADGIYKQVTVRLHGKGVTERGEVSGFDVVNRSYFLVREGQFILSRIDARNGAFGLVPASLDGAIVTRDFPSFEIDQTVLLPSYMLWLSKTPAFIELCKQSSEGTTNRVRLQESRFLRQTITLPPLAEQRRIVERIEALAGKVEEARRLRETAVGETSMLFGAKLEKEFGQLAQEYGSAPFGTLVSFRNDLIRPTDGKTGSLRFVGLQHVEPHTGRKIGEDWLEAENLTGRKFVFSPGEIVYGYLRPYLNKVWIADCEGICSVDQYVIRPDANKINREYLAFFMRSPVFLQQAIELTHNLMLPRLRTALLESIPVPLPPLQLQEQHVSIFQEFEGQIERLRQNQNEVQQELDILMPSILDKAFKGEL